MAKQLRLRVVAKGVDGCDEIQGYWLSPPLDAHRCLGLIRTWAPDLNAAVMP